MRLLPRLLGHVYVLAVRFTSEEECERTLWRITTARKAETIPYDAAVIAKGLCAVTVDGYGVIRKTSDDAGIAAKVREAPETFVWSEQEGTIFFVRRTRLVPLLEELSAADIRPALLACGTAPAACARQLYETLRWRELLRLNHSSSALAQAVARRMLPVWLGLFFLLLCLNSLYGPQWQARRQLLQQERQARETAGSRSAESSVRQRQLLADFRGGLPVDCSLLCDRIGALIPAQITLTQLDIEPVVGRIDPGKPLKRRERTVVLTGLSRSPEAVTTLNDALTRLPAVREVRLVSVDRTRDDRQLQFLIELQL